MSKKRRGSRQKPTAKDARIAARRDTNRQARHSSGGVMSGMLRGFRRPFRADEKKKRTTVQEVVVTVVLLIVTVVVLVHRCA